MKNYLYTKNPCLEGFQKGSLVVQNSQKDGPTCALNAVALSYKELAEGYAIL